MDTFAAQPNSVRFLRESGGEDTPVNDEQFNATLDALLDNDSDGTESPFSKQYASSSNRGNPKQAKRMERETDASVTNKRYTNPSKAGEVPLAPAPLAGGLPNVMMPFLFPPSQASASHQMGHLAETSSDVGSSTSSAQSRKRSRMTCPPPKSAPSKSLSMAISEDEGDPEKRRKVRNDREKQRSQQITSQISTLNEILVEANVNHKADKYSTLASIEHYIKELQNKTTSQVAEHKNLLETIVQASQMVQDSYVPATSTGYQDDTISLAEAAQLKPEQKKEVEGFDFQSIFKNCPFACSIANIDGRFLDVNSQFEAFTGYSRDELLQAMPESTKAAGPNRNMSIFNMIRREDMETMFKVMSEMLRRPMVERAEMVYDTADTWTGTVQFAAKNRRWTRLSITLVRSGQGCPRFFNCILLPTGQNQGPPTEIQISSNGSETSSSSSL